MTLHVDYLASVQLMPVSGVLKDRVQNDFHMRWQLPGAPTSGGFDDALQAIRRFYDQTTSTYGNSLSSFLSSTIKRSSSGTPPHVVQFYNIINAATPLGVPEATRSFHITGDPSNGYKLPSEMAACLSFWTEGYDTTPEHGAGGTRPKARRRGRLYLGPLDLDAGVFDVTGAEPRLSTGLKSTALGAAIDLNAYLVANDWDWSVYSKADDVGRSVYGAWIDDTFDVQRRRGPEPSSRTSVTF